MRKDWIWQPCPGHFIAADECRYRLNTYIPASGVIVSTIGDMKAPEGLKKALSKPSLLLSENGQWMKVGWDRFYETMVFIAYPVENCGCSYAQAGGASIDFAGYNSGAEAYAGHMKMCFQWDRKTKAQAKKLTKEQSA